MQCYLGNLNKLGIYKSEVIYAILWNLEATTDTVGHFMAVMDNLGLGVH